MQASLKSDSERVVITGMGVVSPLGHDPQTMFERLCAGESGIVALGDEFSDLPTRIAGVISDFSADGLIEPKKARRMDKVHQYAIATTKLALRDAGFLGADGSELHGLDDRTRAGVLIGSAMGGMNAFESNLGALNKRGVRTVSPFAVPYMLSNMSGAIAAMEPELGLRGPNYAINTACATANYCLLAAMDHITRGDADVMVAGGTEAPITRMGMAGFIACKALSRRNDEPQHASRPWDTQRDGFVMGEGSGALVLESLAHAKQRGARIVGELLGGAISTDAYDLTAPREDGRDVILCMQRALERAGLTPEDVDYCNAHGTSTPRGDLCEIGAIRSVFGHDAKLKINSTKSMLGHSLGAAGALEAIAVLKSIEHNKLHPTINHDNPEPEICFDVVPNEAQSTPVSIAISNSFGFGGHNSTVVLAEYHD